MVKMQQLTSLLRRRTSPADAQNSLDFYTREAPSAQGTIDIFKGEWASSLPNVDGVRPVAGAVPLFEDDRIQWAFDQIGGVAGLTALELGPLEAGHTAMLERAGAKDIVAIESNARAYLKCLIIKELLGLKRVKFLHGDCVEYLRATCEKRDLCIASGVLYHMKNPVEVIARIARSSDIAIVWTQYYDHEVISKVPALSKRYDPPVQLAFEDFIYRGFVHHYGDALNAKSFCGGSAPTSVWIEHDTLMNAFKHFGLSEIVSRDVPHVHQHGSAVTFVARRPHMGNQRAG